MMLCPMANKGDWDRSIADYTNAMALDPLYCHCHRGLAYLNKGEWDHAIDD
jgi:hypothetical protein